MVSRQSQLDSERCADRGEVLATVIDMCERKPEKVYAVPNDQEIYAATRISLANTSSSSSPSTSTSPSNEIDGLSTGVLAGIVLAALVGIAMILAGLLLLLRRKRRSIEARAAKAQVKSEAAYTPTGDSQDDHVR